MAQIVSGTSLGKDSLTGGKFGNLTPGGLFSNIPRYYEYAPTKDSVAKLTLTLSKVKDAIKEQLKKEAGADFNNDLLVESFLYEFTTLLVDYRDLRNHVFFGSAYTELAYNIKYIVDNYPYKFLISTLTTTLNQLSAEFTFSNDTAKEETTFFITQSAIKDGKEEFNFFDNNIEFNWLDYDLVDKANRRYPIKSIITPYDAASGIFAIVNIAPVTVTYQAATSTDPAKTYDTLQVTTAAAHGYAVGQAVNIFDNVITSGSLKESLNSNYYVSKVISPTVFQIVSKYAGQKISQGIVDLVTEAVELPVGYTVTTQGRVRKVPLSQNTEPYIIKMVVDGNVTETQLITYDNELNASYSGFMLSKKQEIISEFEYTLSPVQKMLLAPQPLNPTPWPRRIVTQNIQHLLSDSVYNSKEVSFVEWLQSPTNLYLPKEGEDDDLAYSDAFNEYRLVRALALDETETNQLLRRCIPADIISELNDPDKAYFQRFILIAGWFFDQIKVYIDFIKYVHHLNYGEFNQLSPEYYKLYADYYGFELFSDDSVDFSKLVIQTEPGYYFVDQNTIDTTSKYYRFTLRQLQYEKQKRLLLSLFYLYKTKGTPGALKKLVALLGAPEGFLVFNEYNFSIQDTDNYDYYDVATLRGVKTVDNEKIYVPGVNFEIDPDYPVGNNMPPVYRMRLDNESKLNLRTATVQTNPNGAIDHQIINLFGKQKYDYAKFNSGEFATLGNLKKDFTVNQPYYLLPLTIPDKFAGITVEYMIPRDGFKKGIGNNLSEVTVHLCSLYEVSSTPVTGEPPALLNDVYTYPLPEVFSNFDYSSVRTSANDTTAQSDNTGNTKNDFNALGRYMKNDLNISLTKPYVIVRLEGKDLVVRARITKETATSTSDIGERVAIIKNVFEADGLNHSLRIILRAEGVELYKDYKHLASQKADRIGIGEWKDPTQAIDGVPYTAFEIPKERISSAAYKPYDDAIFVSAPDNEGEDAPTFWDMFIGLPSNIDFYFKKVEVFENYSIDSFNTEDKLINVKNYTGEFYSFDFSHNAGNDIDINIKAEFSQIEPDLITADYAYVLPVEAFANTIVVQDLGLTSKSFKDINSTKHFHKQQNFFEVQRIFNENAYQKFLHKDYYYDNFNGKLNELYALYSPQVLTYSALEDFLELIETKFKKTIRDFIPIVINVSEFGRLVTNSAFVQAKAHYANIHKACEAKRIGDFAILGIRPYSTETSAMTGEDLTISLTNPVTGTTLIGPLTIAWQGNVDKTLALLLNEMRSVGNNPNYKYVRVSLQDGLVYVKIDMNWYSQFGNANDVQYTQSTPSSSLFTKNFANGYLNETEESDCGSIEYSLPSTQTRNIYVYFDSEDQQPRYIYFNSENKPKTHVY